MIKTKHLVGGITNNLGGNVILFQIPCLGVNASRNDSKLDILQKLALYACPFAYSLAHLGRLLTRFQEEPEGNAVRLACLLVEMIAVDELVLIRSSELVLRNLLSIQRGKLVDADNIEIFHELLVNFAAVDFINANMVCCSLIKVELLDNTCNEITDDAVLGDQDLEKFLRLSEGAIR